MQSIQQPELPESTLLKIGADRIQEIPYQEWFEGKRLGLITNQTGVTSELRSLIEVLEAQGLNLTTLFGPEHGIHGEAQAGEAVASGPQVYSLYGDRRAPTPEMLAEVDLLLYDIQDVGVRFYTFISTMFESMKVAASEGIPFIVLDRPDPVNGVTVEGPVLEPEFVSFVGIHAIPVRYGLTAGEIAQLLKGETQLELDLRVVPMEGWNRELWYDHTGLEWIAPSPNMPTVSTATVYPGFCLIEGTNLSEGRGTTRPFELIGAPWLNASELSKRLNALSLPGVYFRPQVFTPMFSKYSGESCAGLQIHVLNRDTFEPVISALHLIREILLLHPLELTFREASFDRLAGNNWIRESLLEGATVDSIVRSWKEDLESFEQIREKYLIYR